MKIIGLSGTNGSGKDTVAEMLAERHGYLFADATAMFNEELKKRGLPTDRLNKSKLSAEWRRESGLGVIVDKALAMYESQTRPYKGLVVGSLRHPAEADRVHELGGQVVWVDADPKVRYQRVTANAHARGRAAEDDKTFEEFMADEEREMHPEGDGATLNMAAVKEKADIIIENNGNNKEIFRKEAEKVLGL